MKLKLKLLGGQKKNENVFSIVVFQSLKAIYVRTILHLVFV